MPNLLDIADAVVGELNNASRGWYGQFTASRLNVPILNRDEVYQLGVIVTPLDKTSTTVTRGKTQDVCRYLVGFQKQLSVGDNNETDTLIELVETVQEYFDQGTRLTDYAAVCEQADMGTDLETPWMAITDNNELMLFTAVLRLTFRVHR